MSASLPATTASTAAAEGTSSSGETSLNMLIQSMQPGLDETEEVYVFARVPTHQLSAIDLTSHDIKMLFRENEGWTAIVVEHTARKRGWEYAFPSRQITLNVHSSLDAVGFLAAITTRLATRLSIGVNPVSAYFHDHLFVPDGKEREVIRELRLMAQEAMLT